MSKLTSDQWWQEKTPLCHLITIRLAMVRKLDVTKCWRGCESIGVSHPADGWMDGLAATLESNLKQWFKWSTCILMTQLLISLVCIPNVSCRLYKKIVTKKQSQVRHSSLGQFSSGQSVVSGSLWPMDCNLPGFPVYHQLPTLKLMSIESLMPSNHRILCCPLLLLPSVFPSIRVFSNESTLTSIHDYWKNHSLD